MTNEQLQKHLQLYSNHLRIGVIVRRVKSADDEGLRIELDVISGELLLTNYVYMPM